MSRYLLLFIINIPFVLAAIISALVQYKMHKSSAKRMVFQISIWVIIGVALASAETIYSWLFNNKLTETEPLSLFDVVLFSGLVITFFITNKIRLSQEITEKKLRNLHEEVAIIMSSKDF